MSFSNQEAAVSPNAACATGTGGSYEKVEVDGFPFVASQYKGHTLMYEHRYSPIQRWPNDRSMGGSSNGDSTESLSGKDSQKGLDPYDDAIISSRPRLPVATRTPSSRNLPVRVACHRGDWRNYVENTIEAVESCIAMGADIVEVDVWRTRDGVLILNHDPTLDRTTNLSGKVSDYTYEELKNATLKDGLGNMTEFHLATVEQLLLHTKDRIFVNLDKADLYLSDVVDILERTGLVGQVILKSEMPYTEMCNMWGVTRMNEVIFMPVFNVTADTTLGDIENLFKGRHDAYEINFETEEGNAEKLMLIKKLAERDNAVLWINTIWWSTCGGHSDDRALMNDKDANWGYVIEHIGGGILQTDRPAMLLQYLQRKNLR